MMSARPSVILISLVFFIGLPKGYTKEFDWCKLNCKGGSKHTMCLYKAGGPPYCSSGEKGLSNMEKQAILHYHNELRDTVARGKQSPQPSASNMLELVWDDELATVAQRWVEQCQFKTQNDKCRVASDKQVVGQNLGIILSSGTVPNRKLNLKQSVHDWFNEVKQFNSKKIAKWWEGDWQKTGHYTQLVWAKTKRVGCGVYSTRKGGKTEVKLACNYKPAGNIMKEAVYTEGPAASKCAKKSSKYLALCSQ